ncbi:hypothetical protein TNCV_2767951 [Trichonephila clavipes]|nr:hypothetical protein TNCV_2767951 [Trichonephila clavipes]
MDACKCIVSLRHGVTLNNRRAPNPLVRLMEREGMWEAPDPPPGVFSLKIKGGSELNRTVTWPGFESRRRYGWGTINSYWGTINSHLAASPLVRFTDGVEGWEAPYSPPRSLKIGVEPS